MVVPSVTTSVQPVLGPVPQENQRHVTVAGGSLVGTLQSSRAGDLATFTRLIRAQDEATLRAYAYGAIDGIYENYSGMDLPILTAALVQGDAIGGGFEAMLAMGASVGLAGRTLMAKGTDEQKIGDFYASYMDTDRLAVLGATPLATEVARILAIRSVRDVYVYAGHAQRIGLAHPVMLYVSQDAHDSNAYVASLYQGGLTMPDRDYYLLPDARSVALRGEFRRYVARLLALAGEANADSAALRVTAIEDRIANHHWTRAANRDPVRTYNKVDFAGAARLAPGFDFAALLEGAEVQGVATLDLNQPTYLGELARLVKSTPVADWKLYFKFHLLDAYAPYLSPQIEQAHFEFHERALRGVQQPPPRWQRGVEALGEGMGEMVGRQYVERNFPPEARLRMLQLVDNLTQAFAQSIDSLDWMSPATKAEARRKLARFTVKIGYPERWRDYSALQVVPGDRLGNALRATAAFAGEPQAEELCRLSTTILLNKNIARTPTIETHA